MIIDEILDARDCGVTIDLDYIKNEAECFGFDYIVNAIDTGNDYNIKVALARYVKESGYSEDIIDFLNRAKIAKKKTFEIRLETSIFGADKKVCEWEAFDSDSAVHEFMFLNPQFKGEVIAVEK